MENTVATVKSSNFIEYPSIKGGISLRELQSLDKKCGYVLLEKIHGCCFGFGCKKLEEGGGRTFIQRRGDVLAPNENFHEVQGSEIDIIMREKVTTLCDFMKPEKQIIVFGELFGGKIKIPPRLVYSDTLRFRVFDICMDKMFLPYNLVRNLCTEFDIPFIQPISEAQNLCDLKFPDLETLTSKYQDDGKESIAEGIIIRELSSSFTIGDKSNLRFIYKLKRKQFSERNKQKTNNCDNPFLKQLNVALEFVTSGRLGTIVSNAKSDINISEAALLLSEAAMVDFIQNDSVTWNELSPTVQRDIRKKVTNACFALVKNPSNAMYFQTNSQ